MASPTTAERFGRYHLLHRIAVGGMAEIFLAHADDDGDRRGLVVIKRLRAELERDPEFVRMFLDESAVISRLDHPGIIRVREFGEAAGRHYIALDHVWGESLATLTTLCTRQRQRFPLGAALHIGAEAAAALQHAHALRDELGLPSPVIHRDVTLGNVMVSYAGQVKVLDFGIAKADDRLAQTRVGQIKGTLIYLAPEQLRGAPTSPAVDVYQLGVLLYKALVGAEPFEGRSEIELMEGIVAGHLIRPSQRIPEFPPAIEGLLCKAMARAEGQRFASMAQLEQVLRAFLGDAFAGGEQRLASIVAHITGDRERRQRAYIDGLLDGLAVDQADGELIRWGNVGDEPRTLAVELSIVLDPPPSADARDEDTQVTSLDALRADDDDDDTPERDGGTLADGPRTEVVPQSLVQSVIDADASPATAEPERADDADGTDVFQDLPATPRAARRALPRSEAVLAHVTSPELPNFARLLAAEARQEVPGAFEDEPPPTVPLSALDAEAAELLELLDPQRPGAAPDRPLLRSAASRDPATARPPSRVRPAVAPPPVMPPATDDGDVDDVFGSSEPDFDIDVVDED